MNHLKFPRGVAVDDNEETHKGKAPSSPPPQPFFCFTRAWFSELNRTAMLMGKYTRVEVISVTILHLTRCLILQVKAPV